MIWMKRYPRHYGCCFVQIGDAVEKRSQVVVHIVDVVAAVVGVAVEVGIGFADDTFAAVEVFGFQSVVVVGAVVLFAVSPLPCVYE